MTKGSMVNYANVAVLGDNKLFEWGSDVFDKNTMTFNYIMPIMPCRIMPQNIEIDVRGATVIQGLEKDAAGNTRTPGDCLYGAINWTAVSYVVTNNAASGAGSLLQCIIDADGFNSDNRFDRLDKRVIYFEPGVTNIPVQGNTLGYTQDIMIIGRLDGAGNPAVRLIGDGNTRILQYDGTGSTHLYGIQVENGSVGTLSIPGRQSTENNAESFSIIDILSPFGAFMNTYNKLVDYILNVAPDLLFLLSGGGVSGGAPDVSKSGGAMLSNGTMVAKNCVFVGNSAEQSGGAIMTASSDLTNCLFDDNATGDCGGAVVAYRSMKAAYCAFFDNRAGAAGGGVYASNSYTALDGAFINNRARNTASAVYAYCDIALNMTNCTVSNNVTETADGCAIKTFRATIAYLFHVTVTENVGGGISAQGSDQDASFAYVKLYNSIVAGNLNYTETAPLQTQIIGTGEIINAGSLIEGEQIPGSSPAVNATFLWIFGLNTCDEASGTHKVLNDGIAKDTATAIAGSVVDALIVNYPEDPAVGIAMYEYMRDDIKRALPKDQTGAPRGASGAVTYGAVEEGIDITTVTGVTVSPDAIEVQKGGQQQFAAAVEGTNNPDTTVTWEVFGNSSEGTTISNSGLLTVASEESGPLTVTATSTVDTSKFGTATVTVTDAPPAPVYGISLGISGSHTFPNATEGYGDQAANALTVTVTNTGNQATGNLTVSLLGDDTVFAAGEAAISSIAVGGNSSFTVTPNTGLSAASYTATVTVSGANGISAQISVSFTVNPAAPVGTAPTITTDSLPDGTVSVYYSQTLSATGDAPTTWMLDSGSLPGGLSLNGATGVISGTPTAAGTFDFTVKASNGVSPDDAKALGIVINGSNGIQVIEKPLERKNHFAYIVGYEDGTVRPQNNITRAETAAIFLRLLTQDYLAEVWSVSNSFSDVSAGEWHNNAISALTKAGVLTGYSYNTFAPYNNITRAEFATIAVRFADTSGIDADYFDGGFTDIDGHWAEKNIKLAAQLGYVQGADGLFRPDDYITRAEVMALLNRVLDRHVEANGDMTETMVRWLDSTPDDWFYFDVQEATNSHYYERKPGGIFEKWTELRPAPDWTALEKPGAKPADLSY